MATISLSNDRNWNPTRKHGLRDGRGHRVLLVSGSSSCPGWWLHKCFLCKGLYNYKIIHIYFCTFLHTCYILHYKGKKRFSAFWDTAVELTSLLNLGLAVCRPQTGSKDGVRPYLERGCPGGQAVACQQGAAHLQGESQGSPHGWLLSVGCGPPRPSSGLSHLGPSKEERSMTVRPQQTHPGPGPASARWDEAAWRLPFSHR